MTDQVEYRMTVEAELRVPVATAQLVRFDVMGPADNILSKQTIYRLDQCLTPRPPNTRARFRDHWDPNHFEKLGKVCLFPPGETMQIRSDGGHSQCSILCHLEPETLCQSFDGDLQWTNRRLEASLDVRDANVHSLLLRLAKEIRYPGFAAAALVELIVAQLAIALGRYYANIREEKASGRLAPWRMRLIDERLRETGKPPTLLELAALCNISVRQLTRGFRVTSGQPIGERIAQYKVDNAMHLLATDISIKEIAYSLGFASPSAFCYSFKRATGESPLQFRQHRFASI